MSTFEAAFIGRNHIELKSIDSTNSYLSSRLQYERLPEFTSVSAWEQSNGKGQRKNVWESAPGANLTISYLFYPTALSLSHLFFLNKAIANAVLQTVSYFIPHGENKIKWPNDIVVNGRKICGILIENVLSAKGISQCIVGIGINVNQTEFEFAPHATSMALEIKKKVLVDTVRLALNFYLEQEYDFVLSQSFEKIQETYLENLYRKNEWTMYKTPEGNDLYGCISSVDSKGFLVMQTDNGEMKFANKEIVFISKNR